MAKNVDNEYEKLILVEGFKNCIAEEVKVHIDKRKTNSTQELAVLADKYASTHKRSKET